MSYGALVQSVFPINGKAKHYSCVAYKGIYKQNFS